MGEDFATRTVNQWHFDQLTDVRESSDVILLDLRSANTQGDDETVLRLMDEISKVPSHPPLVVLCEEENRALIFRAIEHGADDSVTNPPNMMELRLILRRAFKFHAAEREVQRLRANERPTGRLHELLGTSAPMQELFGLARKIAPCDVNVLITGETGTGKELLARAIHHLSGRNTGPLVAFSCANLPENLVEDELFGHEKGAFTGALMARRGRVEAADRGTLFLDEIGDLGLGLQPKLLRVIQERNFERLGSNKTISVDIRLICATNRNLAEMVQQGKFREDLVLPAERRADAFAAAARAARRYPIAGATISAEIGAAIQKEGAAVLSASACMLWKITPGRATCANWKMWCSARLCCRKSRPWM